MKNIIRNIIEHQSGSGKKSTALQPLNFLILIVGLLLILCIRIGASVYIQVIVLIALISFLFLFMTAYIYFMLTNPDALRSESFKLTKLAIERGLIGDKNLANLIAADEALQLPLGPDDESVQ